MSTFLLHEGRAASPSTASPPPPAAHESRAMTSSQPAAMAQVAKAGATPPSRGLPDEIFIWEILVRLPPKSLLRCRAVCRAWRRATSTCVFLVAHHAHQPTLPLLYGWGVECAFYDDCLDIIHFDHGAATAQLQLQLRPVATLDDARYDLKASCDGLIILSTSGGLNSSGALYFSVCNPATRQYARLPLIRGFALLGMYPHPSTGEYRLLLYPDPKLMYDGPTPRVQDACYVFALGSRQLPRHIGWSDAEELTLRTSVLCHGSLHWHLSRDESESNVIIVFDTTTESFLQMRAPVVPGHAGLFEMDGMLGMSSFNDAATDIDIWVLPEYESEVWAFKCRVELPVEEIRVRCDKYADRWNVVVVPVDGELLVLVRFDNWLLQVDMDSKLVDSFYREHLGLTQLRLKQILVPHTFFPTLEGYVVNDSPFI